MNLGNLRSLALIATLALTLPALAQNSDSGAKQDMKNAGADTKHAATNVGHGVSQGSKTAYNKTKSGTEKGYDKTKSGTEKGYDKTKSGTETGYHKTVPGTEKGYHKTAQATKTGVHKVEGKPEHPATTLLNRHRRYPLRLAAPIARDRAAAAAALQCHLQRAHGSPGLQRSNLKSRVAMEASRTLM